MANKVKVRVQNKKDNDYVWTCDYCGKEFDTKKLSDAHELKCPQKNREFTIKIKAPTRDTMFLLGSVFIVLYFLIYFVVSSYAKSNGLPSRDLLQPQKWFRSEPMPTTTILPIPTSIPTPTTAVPTNRPKVKNTTSSSSNNGSLIECIGPDGKQFNTSMDECKKLNEQWGKPLNYMTNCELVGKCVGQVIRMSLVDCKGGNFSCCHLTDSWQYLPSDSMCRERQASLGLSNRSDKFILNYPKGSQYLCNTSNRSEIDSLFSTMTESLKLYSTSHLASDLDRGVEAEKRLNTIIDISCQKQ